MTSVGGKYVDAIELVEGHTARCGDPGADPDAGAPVACRRLTRGPATSLVASGGVAYWADGALLRSSRFDDMGSSPSVTLFDAPVRALSTSGFYLFLMVGTAIERWTIASGGPAVVIANSADATPLLASGADGVFWTTIDCQILSVRP